MAVSEKEEFVGRESILKAFSESLDSLSSGVEKNIAVVGSRGLGKSLLLRHLCSTVSRHEDFIPVFVSLKRTSISPENLSVAFAGDVLFAHSREPMSEYKAFMNLSFQKSYCEKNRLRTTLEKVLVLENELQKIRPDQKLLLRTAFSLPSALAQEVNNKCVVFLDDFDELLGLNNFGQIKNVFSVISFTQKNVSFVASMQSELNVGFGLYVLEAFSRQEASLLVRKLIPHIDSKPEADIYLRSKGLPWLVSSLAHAFASAPEKKVDAIFLRELLCTRSPTCLFLQNSYEAALARARGETLLRTVMNVLAGHDALRLSEVARLIYRSAPVTKVILERLAAVGLVVRKEKRFAVANGIIATWLRLQHLSSDSMSYDSAAELLGRIGGELP